MFGRKRKFGGDDTCLNQLKLIHDDEMLDHSNIIFSLLVFSSIWVGWP
jgi:hypothetical protein